MEPKRLYRSIRDRKIGGVCAGLAEYFDFDPLLVRLIFVVLALAGGGGVLIYLVLWVVTPEKPFFLEQPLAGQPQNAPSPDPAPQRPPDDPKPAEPLSAAHASQPHRGSLIGALVLITLGVLFLADEFIPNISFGDLWPIILIVIGIGLLVGTAARRKNN
jgi:phage shock protein C